MLAGYYQMKALSPDGMRPFDRRRRGFLVGEGAGILILESLKHAQARKARIYGEVVNSSYGSDSKGSTHFSDETALAHTLQQLLQRCGWKAETLDYVNLHGTGTPTGDIYESEQLKRAFGPVAYRIPMSSIKAMTGHLLGAAGAVEIIATLLAMRNGFIPPTIGLEEPDPACDLDYTPNRARKKELRRAISLSMGFGGHIATIALERFS
jgi:3-oxoacyl-[acyl-carrier-protein] synthase II